MAISKDLQLLLEGVHHYLAVALPQHPLPEPAELQRVHLLDQLQHVALRYPALNFRAHKTQDFNSTESIDQTKAAIADDQKCEPSTLPGLALVAGAKRVKRSGSVSSRSSSGSYTSTSYTSNGYTSTSYTSNGYGSYEGGSGQNAANEAVQEDIYEEFDAVQLRMPDNQTTSACQSSCTTHSSSSSSSSSFSHSSPFFASLRSSLTYGKKDKLQVTTKSKKTERQSKGKSMEDLSSESICKNQKNAKHTTSDTENISLSSQKTSDCFADGKDAGDGRLENGVETKSDWDVQDDERSKLRLDERRSSGVESLCGQDEEIEKSYMEGLQPIPFSSNIACCSHHGVLQKKTKRLLRHYRPYHAVVANGILFLYNKETDHRQCKSLELCWYDVRVATGEETLLQSAKDSPLLELVAPGRKTHTFMARSVWDRDTWIFVVGQHTKNKACLPLPASSHLGLPSAPPDTETAHSQHSGTAFHEVELGKNKSDVGTHDKKVDPLRGSSDVNRKNNETNLKNTEAGIPLLSRGSSTTSLGTNPLFSFTIKSPSRTGPPVVGPAPPGGDSRGDVCSFPASCDDTFSSEEMYEEVNMDDIRCASGPSLSEMLEPHLFPNGHLTGAYYCVPDENIAEDSTETSTASQNDTEGQLSLISNTPNKDTKPPLVSSPITPSREAKQAPARPPPPNFSAEKLVKNNSALHHIISPKNSLLSGISGVSKPVNSPVNSASQAPPSVRRCLPFSASPRPLPETPQEVPDEGEIYDEIDEDFYEENEADGTSLQKESQVSRPPNSVKKNYSVLNPPPPLPLRGPPPVPSLPPPITSSKNEIVTPDLSLFEDYDVPDNVNKPNSLSKSSSSDGEDLFSASKRPDLSIDLPPFSLSNCGVSSETKPILSQIDTRTSDDSNENVYKVPNPTHPVSEDVYKIPASIPIPVGNNNEKFPHIIKSVISSSSSSVVETKSSVVMSTASNVSENSKLELKPSGLLSCELYQSPPSKSIPVSPLPSNAIMGSCSRNKVNALNDIKTPNKIEKSPANFGQLRKFETQKDRSGKLYNNVHSTSASSNSPSQKPESCVSVKERIALLNKSKVSDSAATPSRAGQKSPDELVLLESKELRLDQARKKAFLESTLNFTSINKTKLDASPLSLPSNR